jgi:phospholipid-binding lipoprotein MlaA
MDPWGWALPSHLMWINYTRTGIYAIDIRARNLDTLDQIRKGSLDYYATMRSLYRQHRNDEIKNYDENSNQNSTAALPDPAADPTAKTPQLSQSN